jgi:hypothetical protein
MRRREFVALMGASVTWPFAAMAQEPGRTYRLGLLLPFPRDAPYHIAFSRNCGATVSSKAKTSRSITAIMGYAVT